VPLLVCLIGTSGWAGASGLRAKGATHRPEWSIPFSLQDRHPHWGGLTFEDKLQQWQGVASLFSRQEQGRLGDFASLPNNTEFNDSINSAGSAQDLTVKRVPRSIALLACLSVGLPLALNLLLYGSERWRAAERVTTAQPDNPEGGSVSILISDPSQEVSELGGAQELKHQRLVAAFQTHSYVGHQDDKGIVVSDSVRDVLVGVSTALVTLVDAVSFSFFTGISLLNSIWAGCIVCMTSALVGGCPGMVSGTSAATAVVLARVSRDPDLGLGPMVLCVFIAGVLQIVVAALRLSRFITLIPHSVVVGCINGLAIITLGTQLRFCHYNGDGQWVPDAFWSVAITAVFTVAVAEIWCRLPVLGTMLPAPLVSIVAAWGCSVLCQSWLPRRTLGDIAGRESLGGGLTALPVWDFPAQGVDWQNLSMWASVVPIAVRFALAGLFESLMTQSLIDEITGTSTSSQRECLGQGVANVIASFFGTQGGSALAVQSFLNVGSGGRGRLSSFVAGALLGLSVLAAGPLVAELPAGAPLGLVAAASVNAIAWSVLELLSRQRAFDCVVAAFVTFLTIWDDIAAAVVAGVIISMLGFAWKVAVALKVESKSHSDSQRTFHLRGPLFFGSALSYRSEIDPACIKEEIVILDFSQSRILDVAGIGAIEKTRDQLRRAGKTVIVQGVSADVEVHLNGQPSAHGYT